MAQLVLGRPAPDPILDDQGDEDDPLGLFKSSTEAYQQDVVPASVYRTEAGLRTAINSAPLGDEPVSDAEFLGQPASAPLGGNAPAPSGKTFKFDLFASNDSAAPAKEGTFKFNLFGDQPQAQEAPPKEPGLDIGGALKKGVKGVTLTWDFLANKLEHAVTGGDKDTGAILAKSVDEYQKLESDPRLAEWVKKGDAAPNLPTALYDMLDFAVRNPTMVANFLAEQAPGAVIGGGIGGAVTAPLKSAVTGAAARAGASKAVAGAAGVGAMGAGINTGAVAFQALGTNYIDGLQKNNGDQEAASHYAITKTMAEVPANAIAGAFLGMAPFASHAKNLLTQATIQGVGGAAGAATASMSVNEDISRGELILEFLGEFATAPVDLLLAGRKVKGAKEEESIKDKVLREAAKDLEHDQTRQGLFDRMMDDEASRKFMVENNIGSPDDPAFKAYVERELAAAVEAKTTSTDDTGKNLPERPEDLAAQQKEMIAGRRPTVMFPEGTTELPLPDGMQRVETERGVFQYDPKLVKPETIKELSAAGRENELLGLGPYNKEEVLAQAAPGEVPHTIVERGPNGEELRGALAVEATSPQTQHIMEANKAPGSTLSVEALADTLEKRKAAAEAATPAPVVENPAAQIDEAAHQAATSPQNALPEPTEGQKAAGTYQKGHVSRQGLDIAVENPAGSTRSGTDPDGNAWRTDMAHHYGYIKGSVGADKDHVDVFIGPNPESTKVFVVDQVKPDGTFDEHKAMLGFNSIEDAQAGYLANYAKDWKGLGAISEMPADAFKSWVKDGKKRKPLALPTGQPEIASPAKPTQAADASPKPVETPAKQPAKEAVKEPAKPAPAQSEKQPDKKPAKKMTVEAKIKQEVAAKKAAEKAKVEERKAAEKRDAAAQKEKSAEERMKALELWEDNDDGKLPHIAFNKLTPERQQQWLDAYPPTKDQKWTSAELHDKIVESQLRSERAERANAKAAKNESEVESEEPIAKFSFGDVNKPRSVHDLNVLVKKWFEETGQTGKFVASHVPYGDIAGVHGVALAQRIAGIFGKRVTFFRMEEGRSQFDGIVLRGSSTIFLNVDASRPYLRVLGHELVHAIRNGDERTYKSFVAAVAPFLDAKGMDAYEQKQRRQGVKTDDGVVEEAIGDLMGDRFGEVQFWDALAEKNPDVFEKIAKTVMQFIDKVMEAIGNFTGFRTLESQRLVTDLNAVRERLANAVASMDLKPEAAPNDRPEVQFSRGEGQTFYSALKHEVGKSDMKAADPQRWAAVIDKLPGVKKEEIERVGVKDWLQLQKGKLTKEQVLNFIAGNQIHVNDVILTDHPDPTSPAARELNLPEVTEPDTEELRLFAEIDILDAMDPDARPDVDLNDMIYDDLKDFIGEHMGWRNYLRQRSQQIERARQGMVKRKLGAKHNTERLTLPGGKSYAEIVLFDPSTESWGEHDDVHFGDVTRGKALAWLRVNERKDADGNHVLFIEEIQSKRAQEARKGEGVPDAPFMAETKAWTNLALKRAIAYAQERGIDRIAWTTGEQQNTRYSMSNVIDTLHADYNRLMKTWDLIGVKDGETVFFRERLSPEEVAAYVGKETAEQIVSKKDDVKLSGLALDINNGDLRPYYNSTIPGLAKKYGEAVVMKLSTGEQQGIVISDAVRKQYAEDGLPLFSRGEYEAQFDDLPPHVRDMAVNKGHYSPPTIKERLDALKPRLWLRVVQGTFDRFRVVRDISMKAYMQLRLSVSTDGAVEGLLHHGQVEDDGGALKLKQGTEGLLDILKPIGGETDRFLLWVAANRASQLSAEQRERFFQPNEIAELKRINLGHMKDGQSRVVRYAEALRKMNELNRSVLDVARTTGLIDQAAYAKFAADIWYVPFYRVMDDDKTLSAAQTSSASVGQYLSKKLKGSERPLNDLMQNVLMNWSHILSASMKNQAAVQTLNDASQLGGIVTRLQREQKGAVKVMEQGKETFYQIDDEFLLSALDAVARIPDNSALTQVARSFKTTLTRYVSLSPTFKINNLIRDSIQSIGVSELSGNLPGNVIQGWRAYHDDKADALIGGAMFTLGNAFDGDQTARVKEVLRRGVNAANVLTTKEQAQHWFRKVWEKYDDVSDRMENTNRLALYHQLKAKGASHLEAAYAARDLQDFSLQGNWAAIRWAAQVLPYFNARLQGLYKLGRDGVAPSLATMMGNANASERQKAAKFGLVLGAVTIASLALYLGQMDDEDWQKREDWDRDSFWWFKIPGTEHAVRIPKPFEMGAIASVIERLTEQIVDKSVEGKVFGKRLLAILSDNLAINGVPQIVRPMYELAKNANSFTGRPIESQSMERLSPANRVGPGTSTAAVSMTKINSLFGDFAEAATGGAVNAENMTLSPLQYDHLLRGYLGWVGTVIQTSSNYAAKPFKEGESPDMKIDDILVAGNYVKSLPQNQSRFVTSFYDNARSIAMAAADFRSFLNAGDVEKAMKVAESKGDELALSGIYATIAKNLGAVTQQMRRVEQDKEMSGSEKRVELDRLGQLRIEWAKRAEEIRISRKRGE